MRVSQRSGPYQGKRISAAVYGVTLLLTSPSKGETALNKSAAALDKGDSSPNKDEASVNLKRNKGFNMPLASTVDSWLSERVQGEPLMWIKRIGSAYWGRFLFWSFVVEWPRHVGEARPRPYEGAGPHP